MDPCMLPAEMTHADHCGTKRHSLRISSFRLVYLRESSRQKAEGSKQDALFCLLPTAFCLLFQAERIYLHPSTLAKRGTVLLFLAIVAFYTYGLGHLPLVGPDEPRYAQVAREMFLRRDLITPTLGGHTWFEKPALLYWMMILSFKLFGVSEWSARLPGAISGVLTVAAVFAVSRRIERDKDQLNELQGYAFWSAVAAATMIGVVVFSQAASFDIVLTMTTTWALAFYFLQVLNDHSGANEKTRGWPLMGFYFFIGLSLLAKGLVGIVIPVGVLGL